MKIKELREIIRNELKNYIRENISNYVTLDDFRNYLEKLGYEVYGDRIKKTDTGFEANLKQSPNLKHFTQIGKNNWVRLSFKDVLNPKITRGKFLYTKK